MQLSQTESLRRFRVETHLHTSEGSACGQASGAEQARARKAEGYDAIIVTDHFFRGNTRPNRALPWEAYVDAFCSGYEHAKAEGDRIGLKVFFGWEENYGGAEFLIYGLDKAWLLAHPEMIRWTPEEQYRAVSAAGGLVIQAHPFRERPYLKGIHLYPHDCDGVEGVNLSQPWEQNRRALDYARSFGLPVTAGSDIHTLSPLLGGMIFPRPLDTIRDFIHAVRGREEAQLLLGASGETLCCGSENDAALIAGPSAVPL